MYGAVVNKIYSSSWLSYGFVLRMATKFFVDVNSTHYV